MTLPPLSALAITIGIYTAIDGPSGFEVLPPAATQESCVPAVTAYLALYRLNYRHVGGRIWEAPTGKLIGINNIDGYACAFWSEKGWAV